MSDSPEPEAERAGLLRGDGGDAPSWLPADHAFTVAEAMSVLGADAEVGLTAQEHARRLALVGENRIAAMRRVSLWHVFLSEIREPLQALLLVVGVLYTLWNAVAEAVVAWSVILLAVFAEVLSEFRAKRALEQLALSAEPTACALRDGAPTQVPASSLVPGDILLVEAGQVVPADARLLRAEALSVQEDQLTGEALPVFKHHGRGQDMVADEGKAQGEAARRSRTDGYAPTLLSCCIYAGSHVLSGRAAAVVTATGAHTVAGATRVAARSAKPPKTPLQRATKRAALWLAVGAVLYCGAVAGLGILRGLRVRPSVLSALSLAFAIIPEELPILIKVVLAVCSLELARSRAVVRGLRAAEALGDVTTIVTDKTGTLTRNVLRAVAVQCAGEGVAHSEAAVAAASPALARVVRTWAAATPVRFAIEGDASNQRAPFDRAMQQLRDAMPSDAKKLVARVEEDEPLVRFLSFNERMRAAGALRRLPGGSGGFVVYRMGAPEFLLAGCALALDDLGRAAPLTEPRRDALLRACDEAGRAGQRLLGFVVNRSDFALAVEPPCEARLQEPLPGDVFVGWVAFEDELRGGVEESVRECQHAGVRVVLVTGDHPQTALAVARTVGIATQLDEESVGPADLLAATRQGHPQLVGLARSRGVFARMAPAEKHALVTALQGAGERVLVTGDGANDAPALAAADVGVAMGVSGSDVAREAAGVVLLDDNFGTIVTALREGRRMADNLVHAVAFYLACKFALIAVFAAHLVLDRDFPMRPLQLIVFELFMDVGCTAAFAAEPAADNVMRRPPASLAQRLFSKSLLARIVFGGMLLVGSMETGFFLAGRAENEPQSVVFGALVLGHAALALSMRTREFALSGLWRRRNPLFLIWLGLALALVALAFNVSVLADALSTVRLTRRDWMLVFLMPAGLFALHETGKAAVRHARK